MIQPKSKAEINTLREGGKRHAEILAKLSQKCAPGIGSFEIEDYARQLCQELKVTPAFLNYQPEGASYPFPAALCFSINDEIVHGIPNDNEYVIQDGDVVTLDLGIVYEGLITDAATTIIVGTANEDAQALLDTAWQALDAGIAESIVDNPVAYIGRAIEQTVRSRGKYAIYRGLVGHGVGYSVHEEPNVPNFDTRSKLPRLPEGAVIAIEPMIGLGTPKFVLDRDDDWTYKTVDGSISVHVEHTVAVTDDGPLILTAQ